MPFLFVILWIPLTAAVTLGGGGCVGFIVCLLAGVWFCDRLGGEQKR